MKLFESLIIYEPQFVLSIMIYTNVRQLNDYLLLKSEEILPA